VNAEAAGRIFGIRHACWQLRIDSILYCSGGRHAVSVSKVDTDVGSLCMPIPIIVSSDIGGSRL